MAQPTLTRRLAAILSADVVGYSRLVEADEAGTIATLTAHHDELIAPAVAAHGGRIVKTTGDGWLVEFPSIVAGLECAIAMQRGMAKRNAGVPPARAMLLRIGVNLGDIIVENDDLYGEGVNLTARLETLAEPGEIVISQAAYDHVRSKVAVGYEDLGEQQVKNIAEPVHAYRVLTDPAAEGAAVGEVRPRRRALRWSAAAGLAAVILALAGISAWLSLGPPDMSAGDPPADMAAAPEPSLAVLPLQAIGDDDASRTLGAELRQGLLGALAAASDMPVRAADADGPAPDPQRLGEALGTRYVLSGNVEAVGDRLRIDARLFDTAEGREIWSRRYELASADRAGLEAAIVNDLAAALGLPPPETAAPPEPSGPPAEGRSRRPREQRPDSYLSPPGSER